MHTRTRTHLRAHPHPHPHTQSVGKEMLKVLTKLGVEAVEAQGEEFDPNLHNAIQVFLYPGP